MADFLRRCRKNGRQEPEIEKRQKLGKLFHVFRMYGAVTNALLQQFPPERGQHTSVCRHSRRQYTRVFQYPFRLYVDFVPFSVRLILCQKFPYFTQSIPFRMPAHCIKRVVLQKHPVPQSMRSFFLAFKKTVKQPFCSAGFLHNIRNRGFLISL